MKLDRTGKNISALAGLVLGAIYFFGGIFYSIPQVMSETLWGMSVFFMCLYWFPEES